MKAVRFHSPGGPEVLTYEDIPEPVPGEGEAIVRVRACGVNRLDISLRSGKYKTQLPRILGTDVAGTVEQVGEGVKKVSPGDKVLVYPVISDGTCRYCLEGKRNECVNVGLLGSVADGGYAELLRINVDNLMRFEGVDFEVAASLPVNFATAWNGLVNKAKVKADDVVLVWGASSGLGHAAIEIAKMHGATVIATAGSDAKLRKAKELGADYLINHASEDVAEKVKEYTDGLGASIVFDHVGSETWPKSLSSLRKNGILLSLGITTGSDTMVSIPQVYRNELRVYGVYAFTYFELYNVLLLAIEKRLRPVIDSKFKLSDAKAAHQRIESREHFGKILLIP
ncbi:MAG: zinc-binding dehydrogenase [Conexivisphaerales archaeon]